MRMHMCQHTRALQKTICTRMLMIKTFLFLQRMQRLRCCTALPLLLALAQFR